MQISEGFLSFILFIVFMQFQCSKQCDICNLCDFQTPEPLGSGEEKHVKNRDSVLKNIINLFSPFSEPIFNDFLMSNDCHIFRNEGLIHT